MAINFPDNPTLNDTYTYNGKTWKWNGSAWEKSSATETGNVEGSTGSVAYYYEKGSNIRGATALYWDDANSRLGIGTSSPDTTFHVEGSVKIDGGGIGGDPNSQRFTIEGMSEFIGGLSADGITCNTSMSLPTNGVITDGSSNSVFKISGDRYIDIGDADASGNDTSINIRDTHTLITLKADTKVDINSPILEVDETIQHGGDPNTKITFPENDTLALHCGGITFAQGVYDSANTKLGAPQGITASGQSQFAEIKCDGLTVGGYWAGGQEHTIGIHVDNGSSVLTTGSKGFRIAPFNCEVVEWQVLTSTIGGGDISWGIKFYDYANWLSSFSSLGGTAPNLSSSIKNIDTSVDWTTKTFSAGNILEFTIDSVATITNCQLILKIRRTS